MRFKSPLSRYSGKGGSFFSARKNAQTGLLGENSAAEFLRQKGFEILEQNYTISAGEIDIVAKDGPSVVFVEVKTLTQSKYYNPEDQVNRSKRRRIEIAAENWMQKHPEIITGRFDVISILMQKGDVQIEHFEDAWNEGE